MMGVSYNLYEDTCNYRIGYLYNVIISKTGFLRTLKEHLKDHMKYFE